MATNRHNSFRVALMLKAKGNYGRNIIEGVCEYLDSTRQSWDLLLEEDFRSETGRLIDWDGDGIVADLDDTSWRALLPSIRIPLVGVGGSYQLNAPELAKVPYVASDNQAIMAMAYHHLIDMGLAHFACYSIQPTQQNHWASEREAAFRRLVETDGGIAHVFNGRPTSALDWEDILTNLCTWLASLPKPVGVVAVTDSRARQVIQACLRNRHAVPDEVAIIGVDDEPLFRMLNRIPISSVAQGTREMGRQAASLLHTMLISGSSLSHRILIGPKGVNAQLSSRHQARYSNRVMHALHFIRQFGARTIKSAAVAEYVGVSRASLDAHFVAELGHTVSQELLKFRLDLACRLLSNEELSLFEVAQRSGFTTTQYMCTVFKRELGESPKAFRTRGIGRKITCDTDEETGSLPSSPLEAKAGTRVAT